MILKIRIGFYFHDIMKIEVFDFNDILINEKLWQNNLVYNNYKTVIGASPLRIRFDKVNGFIKVYN